MLLRPMLARLAEAHTPREVLEVGLADAIALNGAEMGNVQMVGPCGDLIIVAHRNTSEAFLRRFGRVAAGSPTVCDRAAHTRGMIHVEDVSADPAFAELAEFARSVPFTSVLSVALVASRGAFAGVLSVHSRRRSAPSPLERAALQEYSVALADRIAEAGDDLSPAAHQLGRQVQGELACTAHCPSQQPASAT